MLSERPPAEIINALKLGVGTLEHGRVFRKELCRLRVRVEILNKLLVGGVELRRIFFELGRPVRFGKKLTRQFAADRTLSSSLGHGHVRRQGRILG